MGDIMTVSSDKVRITVWMDQSVKNELKRQAKASGVNVSAYVSMLVSERAREERMAGIVSANA